MRDEDTINKETVKEMEMQLHEQFATNYSSGFSSTVALFCTLLAVLYGYGHIFLHSSLTFTQALEGLYTDGIYALDALIFAGIAATIVLFIMKYICVYQGISQRMEQFIIYAIRSKYYGERPIDLEPRIYPSTYHPFKDKDKDLPIGLYGKFIVILCGIQWLVIGSLVFKIICSLLREGQCQIQTCTFFIELMMFFSILIFCLWLYIKGERELIQNYHRRYKEYIGYKEKSQTKEK